VSNTSIQFDTKRDFKAFGELLKRTDLGLVGPDIIAIERIVNTDGEVNCEHAWQDEDYDWHECDDLADVRIVRARGYDSESRYERGSPTDVYSDAFCLACFQREVNAWVQDQLELIATEVFEARERGETDSLRAHGRPKVMTVTSDYWPYRFLCGLYLGVRRSIPRLYKSVRNISIKVPTNIGTAASTENGYSIPLSTSIAESIHYSKPRVCIKHLGWGVPPTQGFLMEVSQREYRHPEVSR